MTIGTSLGLTYEDEFHHAAGVAQNDNNTIDPDTTPDLSTKDNNSVDLSGENTSLDNKAKLTRASADLPVRQPGDVNIKFRDNVEDRRDQPNTIDYAGIKQDTENWITRRVPDILAQHMQPYFFAKSLDPGPSELGNQLGYSDIHTDKAIDQTSPINNAIHGAVDTANLAGAMLQSYRQQPIHRIIDPNTEVPEDTDLTGIAKFGDKLLGRGQPRFQLWPERLIRNLVPDDLLDNVGKIARGEFPMWQMDPETGEFHTSDQAIATGVGMASAATYAAGINPTKFSRGIPLTIQTTPEAHEALQEGPNAFQQFMQTRGRSQPSNIVSHADYQAAVERSRQLSEEMGHSGPDSYDEAFRRQIQLEEEQREPWSESGRVGPNLHHTIPPDEMSDHQFYQWGEYQAPDSMTREQEARWRRLDDANSGRARGEETHESYADMEARWAEEDNYYAKSVAPRIRNAPTVGKKGDLELKELSDNDSTRHKFGFVKDDGTLGELSLHERSGGKDVYVDWIGSLGKDRQFDFGSKNMKDLIGILKDRFPDMETITGFRVSGARAKTGSGSAEASMRVRPKRSAE